MDTSLVAMMLKGVSDMLTLTEKDGQIEHRIKMNCAKLMLDNIIKGIEKNIPRQPLVWNSPMGTTTEILCKTEQDFLDEEAAKARAELMGG